MQVVDDVKARLDIAEYIGRSVVLQRAGRNFRGLCPFHAEKTPSFYVFPDRQTWRCFGTCGEGGDLFTFVQKRDAIGFRDALRTLADAAGVPLTTENPAHRSRLDRLAGVVSATVDFYQRNLAGDDGSEPRAYLEHVRGISVATAAAFRLGWAPPGWRSLRDYLSGRGYSDRDMLDAGVLVESESGGAPYDRFRARLIIPIADERGVFVALGGRGLHNEEPKYLNSPQTDIFDKGRTLFGLSMASSQARNDGTIVVVEGYMDVIGPWQAGFRNVVATMGTSLTEEHSALLRRVAPRIVLAMDPDGAGMAAAERAGSLFIGGGAPDALAQASRYATSLSNTAQIDIRVAALPGGHDPDELARANPAAWESAIAASRPYAEYLIRRLLPAVRPDSPVEVRRAIQRIAPVIRAQDGPIEQSRCVQLVAGLLRLDDENEVWREIRPRPQRPRERLLAEAALSRRESRAPIEVRLLALLMRHPSLRDFMRGMPLDLFADAANREICGRLVAGTLTAEGVGDVEPDLDERISEVRRIRDPELSAADALRNAQDYVTAIRRARQMERQETTAHELEEFERQYGSRRLAEVTIDAWNNGSSADGTDTAVQTVIENMEVGRSLHRREDPRLS